MRWFFPKTMIAVTVVLIGTSYFGYMRTSGADSQTKIDEVRGIGSEVDKGAEFSSDPALPFRFSTGKLFAKIAERVSNPAKDAQYISANYKACGPKYRPKSYFPTIVQTMKKLPETAYSIDGFQIILIPNLLGYNNLAALQEDFFACPGDTGVLVPAAMNEHWLVFTRSCEAQNEQCLHVASIVTPTIQIK